MLPDRISIQTTVFSGRIFIQKTQIHKKAETHEEAKKALETCGSAGVGSTPRDRGAVGNQSLRPFGVSVSS